MFQRVDIGAAREVERPAVWVSERPTEPGYYWFNPFTEPIRIVHVIQEGSSLKDQYTKKFIKDLVGKWSHTALKPPIQ